MSGTGCSLIPIKATLAVRLQPLQHPCQAQARAVHSFCRSFAQRPSFCTYQPGYHKLKDSLYVLLGGARTAAKFWTPWISGPKSRTAQTYGVHGFVQRLWSLLICAATLVSVGQWTRVTHRREFGLNGFMQVAHLGLHSPQLLNPGGRDALHGPLQLVVSVRQLAKHPAGVGAE